MTRFLSKWLRRFHRWIAVPTALLIPAALVLKALANPDALAIWEKLEKLPSLLMLVMAISGAYLYLLPYIVRGQRKKKLKSPQIENNAPSEAAKTHLI